MDATSRTWDGSQYLGNEYTGGTGDDTLRGTRYADVYQYNLGDGSDLLIDEKGNSDGYYTDKIVLGAGIATTDVTLNREGTDLLIGFGLKGL